MGEKEDEDVKERERRSCETTVRLTGFRLIPRLKVLAAERLGNIAVKGGVGFRAREQRR